MKNPDLKRTLRRYGVLRREIDRLNQKLSGLHDSLLAELERNVPLQAGPFRVVKLRVPRTRIEAFTRKAFSRLSFRVIGEKKRKA